MGGFCLECGHRVESFIGLKACPGCGTTAAPCADDWQVTVSINWHELRVLVMWAERHQLDHNLGQTVYAIARRLAAQHPQLVADNPLTLAEELGQLATAFGEVETNDPKLQQAVAEQTGQDIGLIDPLRKHFGEEEDT